MKRETAEQRPRQQGDDAQDTDGDGSSMKIVFRRRPRPWRDSSIRVLPRTLADLLRAAS